MSSIGEIILTNNNKNIKSVEVTEIGFKNVSSVRMEFDIDMLLDRYSYCSVIESYIMKGVLYMTLV